MGRADARARRQPGPHGRRQPPGALTATSAETPAQVLARGVGLDRLDEDRPAPEEGGPRSVPVGRGLGRAVGSASAGATPPVAPTPPPAPVNPGPPAAAAGAAADCGEVHRRRVAARRRQGRHPERRQERLLWPRGRDRRRTVAYRLHRRGIAADRVRRRAWAADGPVDRLTGEQRTGERAITSAQANANRPNRERWWPCWECCASARPRAPRRARTSAAREAWICRVSTTSPSCQLPGRAAGTSRPHRLQGRAAAGHEHRVTGAPQGGARRRREGRPRVGRRRVPEGLRVRPVEPQRDAARGRDRQGTARARRGGTAAAGDRVDARDRAPAVGAAAAQSRRRAIPLEIPPGQRVVAGRPDLHRQGDRHQRDLRVDVPAGADHRRPDRPVARGRPGAGDDGRRAPSTR